MNLDVVGSVQEGDFIPIESASDIITESVILSTPDKVHPCERTLDFLIPEQINAVFIERLFALNESLPLEKRKSRSQILYDILNFILDNYDLISENSENLTAVLNHLSSCESSARILAKMTKQSNSKISPDVEKLFTFAIRSVDKDKAQPYIEALYKDNVVALKKIMTTLPTERKRLFIALLSDLVSPNHLNEVIAFMLSVKKKSGKAKNIEVTPHQLYLSTFKRLDSQAFDEVTKMLNFLKLEEFLPGFKHSMIHDSILFSLDSEEVEELLIKMGLPLGVQLQIKKYISRKNNPTRLSHKPVITPVKGNEIVKQVEGLSL